jgi:hypothetical protein
MGPKITTESADDSALRGRHESRSTQYSERHSEPNKTQAAVPDETLAQADDRVFARRWNWLPLADINGAPSGARIGPARFWSLRLRGSAGCAVGEVLYGVVGVEGLFLLV